MKKLFLICSLLISFVGFGQSVVQRASPANTVDDPNGMNSRSKIIPRYQDTTQANTLYSTLDSAGKIIYTRGDKSFWYRQDNPKKWVKVVSGNNLSGDFFYDSTCECYKIDTTALIGIINNFYGDSSIISMTVLNDSTIQICYGTGNCVNIGIVTSITNISSVYWIGGDSISVCAIDTTGGVVTTVCDTIALGVQPNSSVYQNWLRDAGGNIIEFGSNTGYTSPGLFLGHDTYANTGYFKMYWQGYGIYDYNHEFSKPQGFGFASGTGVVSFLHGNVNNNVKLGINYTADTVNISPFIPGYLGSSIGYSIGTNWQGHGSYGAYLDDNNSKTTGIFFHTYDSAVTDGVTIYAAPDLGGVPPVMNGLLSNYKIAGFNTDGSIKFHKYGVGTFSATPTYNLGVDANGKVVEVDPSSGGGAANVAGEFKKSSVIVNRRLYDAFPSFAWSPNRDTIFVAWKSATDHASDGDLMISMSLDEGSTWSSYNAIQVNGSTIAAGTVSLGYNNGRLIISYTQGTSYDSVKFAKNDLSSTSSLTAFTRVTPVTPTASQGQAAPYGAFQKLPSGKLILPAYTWNTVSDTSRAIFYQSTDNGDSWSFGGNVRQSKSGNVFPEGSISETFILRVEDTATTDANAILMALIRSDTYKGYTYQAYSTNGGSTWTTLTSDWAFGTQNATGLPDGSGNSISFPVTMILDGSNVYAVACRRGANSDYSARAWKAPVSSVYNTPNNWGKYSIIYRAVDTYKGSDIDWGYGSPYITQTRQLKFGLYDMDISDRPGVDGGASSKRIRIVSVPMRGNNYFEAYNGTGNQSVSSGTETTVTTGWIWYDTDSSYNADSAKIYIPEDGFYEIEGRLLCDTSALGTYRTARLYAIDWGAAYGVTPEYSKYLVDEKTIYPSTLSSFCFIRLRGTMYCYKGMEVRMTFQHDKGSSLNILNPTGLYPTIQKNADIKFKKIN